VLKSRAARSGIGPAWPPPARMAWRRVMSSGPASSSQLERAYGLLDAEGAFSACPFWYVEALARAGRPDEARLAFEKVLTYASHVGVCRADQPRRTTARELPSGADPPGADQRRVQPRPCPRRVNRQDLVMTGHPPGGEARFVAKGSHGHEGAPGNTRRSEPPVNPARFTYMSKEKSGGIPNGITTCGRK
jgi:hypothetical protein